MPNTKKLLGLIMFAAAGTVAALLVANGNRRNDNQKNEPCIKGDWKEGTVTTFTGWLEKLKRSIDEEVRGTSKT